MEMVAVVGLTWTETEEEEVGSVWVATLTRGA